MKKLIIPHLKGASLEWSQSIKTIRVLAEKMILTGGSRFSILTEMQARGMISVYDEGAFLIFRKYTSQPRLVKNDPDHLSVTHHLLVKIDSEIRKFDIYNKSYKGQSLSDQAFYNLKNERGEWVFGDAGVSAASLVSFLNSSEVRKQFRIKLELRDVKVLARPKNENLESLSLKQMVIQDRSLSWLPRVSSLYGFQEQALFYFLDTFIIIHQHDIQSLLQQTLFNEQPYKLTYRRHYSLEAIQANVSYLRVLSQNGNSKAAMLLAAIAYSGLRESKPEDVDMSFCYVRSNNLFSESVGQAQGPTLFCDLDEYKEITQNPIHFPSKAARDIFLLRYYKAKNDKVMIGEQLKAIDLTQAIWLDERFCNDYTLRPCLEFHDNPSLQNFISNHQVLHHLVSLGRINFAEWVQQKLPNEVLSAKNVKGENILHALVNYLSIHRTRGSAIVMRIFGFVISRFPEMLSEYDNSGRTVEDAIESLDLKGNDKLREEIVSMVAPCRSATPRRS